jgi:CheY-like chemotaxis protein
MDLQMPEMDGLEATRLIRGLPGEVSNTPIIAFSANAMEATRDQCSTAGMNDFISKPFVTEQLLAKIALWVPGCEEVREAASCLGADSHV